MININYDTLFTIELSHKFYALGHFDDFSIVPTVETQTILSAHRIITKQIANKVFAYIQTDANKPLIIPENGTQLTFLLVLNNSVFNNYTSLSATNNSYSKYYFTNRNNNTSGTKNFLTATLNNYNSATKYSYEDLVVKSGKTFQSVKNNNHADLNTSAWRDLGNDCFVSMADVLLWQPSIFEVLLDPVTPVVNIIVKGYDGSAYTKTVFTKTINNEYNLPKIQIDLSSLVNGKYLLAVNGNVTTIYLNDELAHPTVFGLIDIFIESTLPNAYAILNKTSAHKNELLSPLYSISFLNRATIWKYMLLTTDNNVNITDSTNTYQFAQPTQPTSPTIILSTSPIPLTNVQISSLKLGTQSMDLPNADVLRLNKDPNDVNPRPVFFSEIYLNY